MKIRIIYTSTNQPNNIKTKATKTMLKRTALLCIFLFAVPHASLAVTARPCDIFEAGKTPCVAAHSVVRSLYSNYAGQLYMVQRASDNATQKIMTGKDGFADTEAQDNFCKGTDCAITMVFDQSPKLNHLSLGPPGGAARHFDKGVNASRLPFQINGNNAYAMYFEGGMGYRIENTSGIAVQDEPETLYMVTSGKHYNGGCCFDYGNAETDALDHGGMCFFLFLIN